MPSPAFASLVAAVQTCLDETEAEYGQMPLLVRLMVKRGFVKRSGHDFARWRELLAAATRGTLEPGLASALAQLADHYRGAPARARRGMGATGPQLAIVEARSRARVEAVVALAGSLSTARA